MRVLPTAVFDPQRTFSFPSKKPASDAQGRVGSGREAWQIERRVRRI